MEYVHGKGLRDNYLQTKEPVYRYHYYAAKPKAATVAAQTYLDPNFNLKLSFGIALEPHRTWMIALENLNMTVKTSGKDVPATLVIGNVGSTLERSNVQALSGSSAVFNLISPYLLPQIITRNNVGHRINNLNFLNESIPCKILLQNTVEPTDYVDTIIAIQFSLVIYAYD
jgi:hypothetical protein